MVELLAPAGSREALVAAVESGANAVYLAGNMFGARAYADNFDEDGMREAIRFAHLRGVQIHVTVNTIVDDNEIPKMKEYLRFLSEAGADAVLVQDLGVAKLAHEVAPELPLHASTQMTVHNLDGVLALQKLGFTRVVLSRELTLDAIRYICANCDVEIETFVHGALCVCYSGQCLMSSIIGGRSGNRGRCAQPCRLPYELVDEKDNNLLKDSAGKYLLSPRDIKGINLIPQLIEAGVASLKIEGRMKRPEYVAIVISTYRKVIDSYYAGQFAVTEADEKRLAQIFNRDFTTAYLEKKQGRNMMSDRRPNNRGLMLGRVLFYDWDSKRAVLKLSDKLAEGDQIDFWVKVGGRVSATVKDMQEVAVPKKGRNDAIKKALAYGKPLNVAEAGQVVSVPVDGRVYESDRAFKVYDAELMTWAAKFYNSGAPVRRIPVDVAVSVAVGEPLRISMTDADGNQSEGVTEFIGQQAQKRPLNDETVNKQISRLGTSIFELRNLTTDIQGEVMVPVSEINEARRKAVEALETVRLQRYDENARNMPTFGSMHDIIGSKGNLQKEKHSGIELSVAVDNLEKLHTALRAGADIIIFGGDVSKENYLTAEMYQKAIFAAHKAGKKIILGTPRIIRQSDLQSFHKWLGAFTELKPDGICAHNIGTFYAIRELTDIPVQIDYSLISYNHNTMQFWNQQDVMGITLSPELNFTQIEAIAKKKNGMKLECLVDGNLELMVSEYCCTGSFLGGLDTGKCGAPCVNAGKKFFLKDRKGVKFPLVMDQNCHMHLLNGNRLSMLPHAMKFAKMGIDVIRIDGRFMGNNQLKGIIENYRYYMNLKNELNDIEKEEAERKEGDNITRGHFFRGVL